MFDLPGYSHASCIYISSIGQYNAVVCFMNEKFSPFFFHRFFFN